MWVPWIVARRVVLGLMLVALAFVGLEVTLPLLTTLFLDSAQGMDARAQVIGQLPRIPVLAFALWVAIEALDVRGPEAEVPRHVLNEPTKHEVGPHGGAPFC